MEVAEICDPHAAVGLRRLMAETQGLPEVVVGIIDGPVAADPRRPALADDARCTETTTRACQHGTIIFSLLANDRTSFTPGICPKCKFIVRPILSDETAVAPSDRLAAALRELASSGARVVNLSVGFATIGTGRGREAVRAALDDAAAADVLIVAAMGNSGAIAGSTITSHPAVLPVAAGDTSGRAIASSNLSLSCARRGLLAPGAGITATDASGQSVVVEGTSVAAPFVTGCAALLFSLTPAASCHDVMEAMLGPRSRRRGLVPPMLDAWSAHRFIRARFQGKG